MPLSVLALFRKPVYPARTRVMIEIQRSRISLFLLKLLLLASLLSSGSSALSDRAVLEREFQEKVQPFIESYCVSCHGEKKPKADLNLGSYSSLQSLANDHKQWGIVLEQLKSQEMPPEKAKLHPSLELRSEIIAWIESFRRSEAERNAGDPGIVLARRLNNA